MYEILYLVVWYCILAIVLYKSRNMKYHLGLFIMVIAILFPLENLLIYFKFFQYFGEPKIIFVSLFAILLYFPFVSISVELGKIFRWLLKTKRIYPLYLFSTMIVSTIFDYSAYLFGYWIHIWNYLASILPIALEAEVTIGIVMTVIIFLYDKFIQRVLLKLFKLSL